MGFGCIWVVVGVEGLVLYFFDVEVMVYVG